MVKQSLSGIVNERVTGSGSETVILAHGFGGDHSFWDKINPFLSQHFKVIAFDWPFSGAVEDPNLYDPAKYSSNEAFADDLITFLDENSLKSSVFVGHSMSGIIGCIASVKRPELFKRLILIGTSPRYINTDDYEGGFNESDVVDIITNMETNYENWVSNFVPLVVDANDPLSADKFAKGLKAMRPEVAVSVAKIIFYYDGRDVLDKVTTPCTIIQTADDFVVPRSVVHYMQEKMIQAKPTVEIIQTNGHFPHLTSHLQFLDVLAADLGINRN